jgi:hypothetical protein
MRPCVGQRHRRQHGSHEDLACPERRSGNRLGCTALAVHTRNGPSASVGTAIRIADHADALAQHAITARTVGPLGDGPNVMPCQHLRGGRTHEASIRRLASHAFGQLSGWTRLSRPPSAISSSRPHPSQRTYSSPPCADGSICLEYGASDERDDFCPMVSLVDMGSR